MKIRIALFVLLGSLVGLIGAPAAADDVSDLAGRAKAWMSHYNSGALEDVAALYSEDGCRMPPHAETVCGRDTIAAALKQGMEMGVAQVKIELTESSSSGDMAWGHGTFEILSPTGESVDRGNWMNVSKRAEGNWLIYRDTFNSELPMPAPPAGVTLIGVHDVEDGDHWLAAWRGEDSRHALFEANGASSVRTFRSQDHPNFTGLVIQVTDMDALTTMLSSPEGVAAAAEDGVKQETLRILGPAD